MDKSMFNNSQTAGMSAPSINPFEYPTVKCSCGNETFVPAVMFKSIPGAVVGEAGQSVDLPLKVFICSKCGKLCPKDQEMMTSEETETKKETKSSIIQTI